MANQSIVRLWCGTLFGTNTGNIFLELDSLEHQLHGVLYVREAAGNYFKAHLTGSFFDGQIKLIGKLHVSDAAEQVSVELIGVPDGSGNLRGKWYAGEGAAGTFVLYPHEKNSTSRTKTGLIPREELAIFSSSVGVIRLYKSDLAELANEITNGFNSSNIVVTTRDKGLEIRRFFPDFPNNFPDTFESNYIRMSISEPSEHDIVKFASVEFFADGVNLVQAQSSDADWARGKGVNITNFLKKYEVPLASYYKKYGLRLNELTFVALLVVLPEISTIIDRIQVTIITFVILNLLAYVHKVFVPLFYYKNKQRSDSLFDRLMPYAWSLFVTIVGGLAVLLIYDLFFSP